MIPYSVLKSLIIDGVRFSYESYDHKKALEEVEQIKKAGKNVPYTTKNLFELVNSCWGIPDEIKRNHIVWRTGRVWQIFFNKNGEMYRFKIGQRYAKNFTLEDFGVKVKPMIFRSDDEYGLIGKGLAVEETM